MINDASGNLTFDFADRTSIVGKNLSGGDVNAGTPVYITSYESDNIYGVDKARNDVDGKAAIGIYQEDVIATETGNVILSGLVRSSDLDTSGFSVGDELFLGVDVLQNTKPTGTGVEIQKLGTVLRSSATNGEIILLSGGGGGSLETLNMNHIFIGSGSVTENLHLSGALNRATLDNVTALGTGSFGHLIINGNVTASGVIRADAFESVTEGSDIDFQDSLSISGSITAQGNISSSLSSTASFGLIRIKWY